MATSCLGGRLPSNDECLFVILLYAKVKSRCGSVLRHWTFMQQTCVKWWHQEQCLAKVTSVYQNSPTILVGTSDAL